MFGCLPSGAFFRAVGTQQQVLRFLNALPDGDQAAIVRSDVAIVVALFELFLEVIHCYSLIRPISVSSAPHANNSATAAVYCK